MKVYSIFTILLIISSRSCEETTETTEDFRIIFKHPVKPGGHGIPEPGFPESPVLEPSLPIPIYPLPPPLPLTIDPPLNSSQCNSSIYGACHLPKTFTTAQLNNVKTFLQNLYTGPNSTCAFKPDVPICPQINVRQNWKCLGDTQRYRLIAVWQKMYEQGIMSEFADVNFKYWPAIYKTGELIPHIRRVVYEFDQAMKEIDPRVTLPYWEWWTYASQAERQILLSKWIGTNGTYANGWCVENGILFNTTIPIPCLKRHWSWRGTVYPYAGPEFVTSAIQTSEDYPLFLGKILSLLYLPMVALGGYEGQLSYKDAPYDPLFFMSLAAISTNVIFRWQLQSPDNICPLSYNVLDIKYNQTTGDIEKPDVLTDTLTSYGTPIKEGFWLGYGVNCLISDQLVDTINTLITKGIDTNVPDAIYRLNPYLREKYFPAFLRLFSRLDHVFENVGNCNTEGLPLAKPTFLDETEAGRKVLRQFAYDNGNDEKTEFELFEKFIYELWYDLSKNKYISPYTTSY